MATTPGPWRYDSVSKCVKRTDNGHVVVDLVATKLAVDLGNHVDCDGRLIAAAPEMKAILFVVSEVLTNQFTNGVTDLTEKVLMDAHADIKRLLAMLEGRDA